jgi:glutamate-5-semialdehyde dehydrogenase
VSDAARDARRAVALLDTRAKDAALRSIAGAIEQDARAILAANAIDVAAATGSGTSAALVDRLTLDDARVAALAHAVRAVADLPDPCGMVVSGRRLPNGLEVRRVRVPLGRVLVVYEARPNVTVDVAALCLKAGCVALLRGSTSARHTNAELVASIRRGLSAVGGPVEAVSALDLSRDELAAFVADPANAEVVVPRGGEALKDFLLAHARIPVLVAAGGNCHVYVDATADVAMAEAIIVNAKTQRPGVCNAAETLLVHRDRVGDLPRLLGALVERGCVIRGDEAVRAAAPGLAVAAATAADWATEYLDLVLAVRVVDDLDAALDHIARYATGHSEAIVTADVASADRFLREVDSACVYVNASTRFTDGGEFGFGAEIGNATGRLHVRGPIGLEDLTSLRYEVRGAGHVRP